MPRRITPQIDPGRGHDGRVNETRTRGRLESQLGLTSQLVGGLALLAIVASPTPRFEA
jgi:hypothetical protein